MRANAATMMAERRASRRRKTPASSESLQHPDFLCCKGSSAAFSLTTASRLTVRCEPIRGRQKSFLSNTCSAKTGEVSDMRGTVKVAVQLKTMLVASPITWNGIAPRARQPDPLWNVLSGILVLVADRGQRIRVAKQAKRQSAWVLECAHALVSGTSWYRKCVPPFWKTRHLVERLVALTSQSWWDQWRLWRAYRHSTFARVKANGMGAAGN